MVMLGYFQRTAPSEASAKAMWSALKAIPLKRQLGPADMGVYIRCTSHYPKPSESISQLLMCSLFLMLIVSDITYISGILDSTEWEHVHVMYNEQDCKPEKYMNVILAINSSYDAILDGGEQDVDIPELYRSLSPKVFDIVHDIAMLMSYKKLIIMKSSFAFWGAFLSNADEVGCMLCVIIFLIDII